MSLFQGHVAWPEFYPKRAFFISYLPLLKNSQPVFPDNFMGPKNTYKLRFKT